VVLSDVSAPTSTVQFVQQHIFVLTIDVIAEKAWMLLQKGLKLELEMVYRIFKKEKQPKFLPHLILA
jgi:hypothetical protein